MRSNSFLVLTCSLFLAGCASVDFDYPRQPSSAVPETATSDTVLGRYASRQTADKPEGHSGFYMLPNAIDAMAIRLLLAERAEATIDAQYYLVKADDAGLLFIRALLRAADRGVRVRLLLDDMFTSGNDVGLAALDHHPNIEVRIFNPFANRRLRFMDGLTDLSRINRRMHNKSFTIDNQVTVVGGRNIADEYFGSRKDARFGDLDVFAVGPVVGDVSESFDTYWQHVRAAPVPAFAAIPDDPDFALERLRDRIATAYSTLERGVYSQAVQTRTMTLLDVQNELLTWAPYELAVDSPDKSFKSKADQAPSIRAPLLDSLASARSEIILVSPYFVPRKSGIDALVAAEERGIEVKVVTNSLSANNQFSVHGGYAPARKPLLKGGVELFEVRRDANFAGQELVAASGAKSTLHTKAFVVDRREVFIGSFNFDPRSARINTEMGVIIRSPQMAGEFMDVVHDKLPTGAWEVTLNSDNRLRWTTRDDDGNTRVVKKEPQTSWWERFLAGVMRLLPIRSQL